MLELRHPVIIKMDEAMANFYHEWLYIVTIQELVRCLTIDLLVIRENVGH